jgi:acyl-CoA synthetase (AMP-forming)/AMP-acid ligase II
VVYEGEPLSYGQLNSRAKRLARCLRDQGVGPDELVGLCVKRCGDGGGAAGDPEGRGRICALGPKQYVGFGILPVLSYRITF